MTDTKRVIEIDGVKIEVDLRTAKRVEELRVGSKVRVLDNTGYGGAKVHSGVIVGFEQFNTLPTMVIAYIEANYNTAEMKFLHYNKETNAGEKTKFEIVGMVDDDLDFNKQNVLDYFNRERVKLENLMSELDAKERYFLQHFKQFWQKEEA